MTTSRKKEIRKNNYLIVPLNIYGMWVHFVFDIDANEAKEFLESTFTNNIFEMNEHLSGVTYIANHSHIVVYLPKVTWDYIFWGTFAHEVFHVAFNVSDIKPFRLVKETDEVFAYLIGFITSTFVKKYTRMQKRKA